jgi:hypothetical protein
MKSTFSRCSMLHGSCGFLICQVTLGRSNSMAEHGCAADAFQRPLWSRFQARLTQRAAQGTIPPSHKELTL